MHNNPNSDPRTPRDYDAPEAAGSSERQRLHQAERQTAIAHQAQMTNRLIQGVYYLVSALQLLLLLRFILRLTAANPDNTFARVIYDISQPFVAPFSTLFVSPTFNGSESIFDVNVMVAIAAYTVLCFLLVWLIRIIVGPNR